jgi:hypothetical protein
MKIDISTLEQASQAIFQYLKDQKVESIEVNEDFYWNISKEERYNPYADPKDLDLGQLSDDWAEVAKIASGDNEPVGYALVWLSSIYKILGEKIMGCNS